MPTPSFFIGPHSTPKSVKTLIWITCATSLLSPVLTYFFMHTFHLYGPAQWLSLSLFGMKQGWLWQPLTYFFLHSFGTGISVSLLFSLLFHMLILWFIGSETEFRFGTSAFLLFYFSAALFSGLVATALLFLFSSSEVIVGSGPPIYALLMLFAMLYPNLEFYFLFFVKVKAKLLVLLLLGLAAIFNLSHGQFITFFMEICSLTWALSIGKFVWKLPNPFPFDLKLPQKRKNPSQNKIIDISVFQESDDDFMDRMLEKIAEKGEHSLTKKEKERMKKISESK